MLNLNPGRAIATFGTVRPPDESDAHSEVNTHDCGHRVNITKMQGPVYPGNRQKAESPRLGSESDFSMKVPYAVSGRDK